MSIHMLKVQILIFLFCLVLPSASLFIDIKYPIPNDPC